jgi:hypothetical protein
MPRWNNASPVGCRNTLAGAERSSALQRAILALVIPTSKRHFAPGDLQFLTSSTYHRAKLFESDRFRLDRRAALCASLRFYSLNDSSVLSMDRLA